MAIGPDDLAALRAWEAHSWEELRSVWLDLAKKYTGEAPSFRFHPLTDQHAGWLFERLILDAFRLDGCVGSYPYRVPKREQVDGLILDQNGWQGFLIESKFKSKPIGIDPVYRLHVLAEQRPIGTLGLFFSASGFTAGASVSVGHLKPIRVLLFSLADLRWALDRQGRMMEMVRRKWAFAIRFGKPDMPIAERKETRLVAVSWELFGKEAEDEDE